MTPLQKKRHTEYIARLKRLGLRIDWNRSYDHFIEGDLPNPDSVRCILTLDVEIDRADRFMLKWFNPSSNESESDYHYLTKQQFIGLTKKSVKEFADKILAANARIEELDGDKHDVALTLSHDLDLMRKVNK